MNKSEARQHQYELEFYEVATVDLLHIIESFINKIVLWQHFFSIGNNWMKYSLIISTKGV